MKHHWKEVTFLATDQIWAIQGLAERDRLGQQSRKRRLDGNHRKRREFTDNNVDNVAPFCDV